MDKKDSQYKEKMENEGVSSKGHNFAGGDHVLLRQRKVVNPIWACIILHSQKINGSTITARCITDGWQVSVRC